MRKAIPLLLCLICGWHLSFSQISGTGGWFTGALVMPGDSVNRWGVCLGFQVRSNSGFEQLTYLEGNGGLTYYISKSFGAMIGLGKYATYAEVADHTQLTATEYRIYEQITNNQFLYRLKLEHRYMAEQRWSEGKYSNRFRYRLNLYVPLNHIKVEEKTWYLSASDEIFLSNRSPNFQRNRVAAGLGYQFNQATLLQAGWLNQYDTGVNHSSNKNYAQVMVIYRIFRKHSTAREYMPSTMN